MMSEELLSLALSLPPQQRAELAHALMDSRYEGVDWDVGGGFCEMSAGDPPAIAEVIELDAVRMARGG